MSFIPRPIDEEERVGELMALQALETLPEPDFSAIAQLAAAVCQAPIALVNLVGSDGQYFKGRAGIAATKMDRQSLACPYVIIGREMIEVPDMLADPRFRDDAWVTGPPYVRFYAGTPVVSSHDHALGTVCVMDQVPRRLSGTQRQALTTLATSAAGLLEAHYYTRRSDEIIQRLRDVEELKNRFLRTVNHELRTPLTSIASYLQLIQDGGLDPTTEQRFLQVIERNSHRILGLIDELLLVASLNARTAVHHPSSVDLTAVTRRAVDQITARARTCELRLRLHADGPVTVSADARRLEHALTQVLDNALKFTPPGGSIDVTVAAGPHPAVEVRDSGIGIGVDDLEHVVEDFYRAPDAEERAIAGTGVGLSITDKIVQMHGGTVHIDSVPGHGTTVRIALPGSPTAMPTG
ncbi:GAF domain-containing sensor histidine kinase [Planobispora takensis]|uniref:histidine kinase n=1 Tax=Planobispora takensis TaxID=1367882 RepID=A0A8J3T270_9ACTN|nr:GAF domain-containing sensor histidine kinase [Planobispora takensis]GII04393.1 sensor histidine kinase [Planobispora takensis]